MALERELQLAVSGPDTVGGVRVGMREQTPGKANQKKKKEKKQSSTTTTTTFKSDSIFFFLVVVVVMAKYT